MGGRHRADGAAAPHRSPEHRAVPYRAFPPPGRRAARPARVQLRWGSLGTALVVASGLTAAALMTNARMDPQAADAVRRPGTTDDPVAAYLGIARTSTGQADPSHAQAGAEEDAGSAAGFALGALVGDGSSVPEPGAGPPLALPTAPAPGPATGPGGGAPPDGPRAAPGQIPPVALAAYREAAATIARTRPGCHLDWSLLAAIGRVESDHGRFGGARLGVDGVARPAILGPRLDGHLAGTAVIRDSDGGRLDGDRAYDRAVGPMQFLPGTWRSVGTTPRAGAVPDPQNIRDAALSAATYLCRAGGDLSGSAGRRTAVLAYNPSQSYANTVLSLAAGYAGRPAPPALGPGGAPARTTVVRTVTVTVRPPAGTTSAPPVAARPPSTTTRSSSASTAPARPPSSTTPAPPPSSTTTSSSSTTTSSSTTASSAANPPGGSGSSSTSGSSVAPGSPSGPPVPSATPSPELAFAVGPARGLLTLRWTAAATGGATVRVWLERLGPDGAWSPAGPGAEATVAPDKARALTWRAVPGRYRAVVQRVDGARRPVGAPLVSSEVVLAPGAPAAGTGGSGG